MSPDGEHLTAPWMSLAGCAVGDWHHRVLENLDWVWERGQSWLIDGPNGSGKSALVALWVGRLDAVAGTWETSSAFTDPEEAWIGFERQRLLLDAERLADDSDYRESPDPGTLVRTFVGDAIQLKRLGLSDKADRGLKHLSTGELRRACLARALARRSAFLLLDEPYEGLDAAGTRLLATVLAEVTADVVYLTQRPETAPPRLSQRWTLAPVAAAPPPPRSFLPLPPPVLRRETAPVLEFRDVNAGYGDVSVLSAFQWQVRQGERWLVTGPNGSGKSTLMALIAGDHPQVFANDIRLFGRKRGPELTLDEVHRQVALVSWASHLRFRNLFRATGLEVLASGFAGTVGLWEEPRWSEVEACRALAADWGLEDAASKLWDDLSWGTQRLLLLGRALVAGQTLLLLDEPCQGLDARAQERVLGQVARWCNNPAHTLIYVTHRPDEIEASTFRRLTLPQTPPD